ncbi:MAG: ferritin-like domain-containing protein [Ketobacter sp.]
MTTLYEDEALFLAHSVALEQEAAQRLYELANTMDVHNNRELQGLLLELAAYSEHHALAVEALCQGRTLPSLRAWEYSWPQEESPEVFHYARVHYLMTAEQALQVALEVEQNARGFYEDVARRSGNPALAKLASRFAGEEAEHVQALQARLQVLQSAAALDNTDFDPPHMPE